MNAMCRTFLLASALSQCLLAVAATGLSAQSLADVARKEEQRRKEVKDAGKVYTNGDLGSIPSAPSAPAAADTPKPAPAADTAQKAQDKDKPADPAKDQAYWAGRKKQLQTQLDRDQTFADALQTKVNSLNADFTSRDDPAQRAVIERDRQKALAELDRLKKAILDGKKALADLDEEARRAGVPPGWLR